MPYVIGVTGTIASGKSAVGKILAKLQVPVFDTDEIVHELLAEPTQTRKAVFERFGQSIADSNGSVNRRALAQIVFADESARRDSPLLHVGFIHERDHPAAEHAIDTHDHRVAGLNQVDHRAFHAGRAGAAVAAPADEQVPAARQHDDDQGDDGQRHR